MCWNVLKYIEMDCNVLEVIWKKLKYIEMNCNVLKCIWKASQTTASNPSTRKLWWWQKYCKVTLSDKCFNSFFGDIPHYWRPHKLSRSYLYYFELVLFNLDSQLQCWREVASISNSLWALWYSEWASSAMTLLLSFYDIMTRTQTFNFWYILELIFAVLKRVRFLHFNITRTQGEPKRLDF